MKGNPMFTTIDTGYASTDAATYQGVTFKTTLLLGVTIGIGVLMSVFFWNINDFGLLYTSLILASIIGFIMAIVGRISVRAAKYCGIIYAACQGLLLGTITVIANAYVPGAALVAVITTVIIFSSMLLLFGLGVIRYGSFIRKLSIGMGISAIIIMLFFPILYFTIGQAQGWSIGVLLAITIFLLIYGAITLTMNFAEVDMLVKNGFDRAHEWSAALGLLVSILYIYIQALRLALIILSKKD